MPLLWFLFFLFCRSLGVLASSLARVTNRESVLTFDLLFVNVAQSCYLAHMPAMVLNHSLCVFILTDVLILKCAEMV